MTARRRVRHLAVGTLGVLALAAPTPAAAQSTGSGHVGFSSTSSEINETAHSLRVTVHRTGALHVNRLLVDYATHDETARAGSDYAPVSGTLAFEVGESVKTIAVRLRDDDVAEDYEHFELRLSNPRGESVTVGAPASIWIWDDDEAAAASAPAPEPPLPAPPVPASASAPPPASAPAPSRVAPAPGRARPAAASRRPAGGTRTRRAAPVRREVAYRSSPVTPFDLRPAVQGDPGAVPAPNVDPVLAALAGIILARVAAEVWFRARAEEA